MNLDIVEAFFIVPLIQYFEKEPKDGFREHTVKKLSGFDADTLNAAVEWIKSNRQASTSFPSPKEAIAAVNAVLDAAKQSTAIAKFDASGATYGAKLRNWLNSTKRAEIIKKGSHEWAEWEIYFRATENKVQWPDMESRDEWTVPTLTPAEFDPSYDWAKGQRLATEARKTIHVDIIARRAFLNSMKEKVVLNPIPERDKAAEEAAKKAAEWRGKMEARFDPDDSGMRSRLGI